MKRSAGEVEYENSMIYFSARFCWALMHRFSNTDSIVASSNGMNFIII